MIIDYLHTENTDGHGCPQADGESEHELSRIDHELKENNIFPQINTDGHGCPQADGVVERELPQIIRELKENNIYPQINTDGHRCPQADGVVERELPQIIRELKENNIYPQINTDGHRCPQADEVGEQQLSATGQQLKENGPQADSKGRQRTEQRVENIKYFLDVIPSRDGRRCNQQEQHKTTFCPQADGGGEHEFTRINRELKANNCVPWMICEPIEVEGKKLLAEIMQGGNFGQYDSRDASLKKGGMIKHGVWKLKRVMRLLRSYPEEALWEPVFRVYHLLWRGING